MTNIVIVLLTIILFSYFVTQRKLFFYLSIITSLILILFQYQSTVPTNYRSLTEIEKIDQLERMNEYPPSSYRLANIIEARPESVIYFKLEKNFINTFDLLRFNSIVTILLLPLFLFGYFNILKTNPKPLIIFSLIPIAALTLIGHQNLSGPFCLYPLIFSVAILGLYKKLYEVKH